MGQSKALQGIVGGTKLGKYPAVQGSEWSVNMFQEESDGNVYLASVPGLEFIADIAKGRPCRGTFVSSRGLTSNASESDLFVCFHDTVYRITTGGDAVSIGNVSTNTAKVSFAESGGERPLLLVADGQNLKYYDLKNGGKLKGIDLPETITGGANVRPSHVAVVSGSIVVNDMNSGYVYYSVPYPLSQETRELFMFEDGEVVYADDGLTIETEEYESDKVVFLDSYQTVQYFNGESSSDMVKAVYAVGDALYLFGPKSVETWQRGSSEYQTWVRTSYTINAANGLEAAGTLASSADTVFYVGSGAGYGKAVFSVTGTTFSKISPTWLDAKLRSDVSDGASAFCYSVDGHTFYVLRLPSSGETWCYDAATKTWHERSSRDPATGLRTMWRVNDLAWYGEKFYAFTSDGGMYGFGDGYWYEDFSADSRMPMVRIRQGAVIVDTFRPFVFEELDIDCNVGTWDDYSQSPKLLLEVSKDGGETFGNVRSASMGKTGDYSHRVRFHGLGYSRLAVVRLTYSHPTDFVLSSATVRAESTGAMA